MYLIALLEAEKMGFPHAERAMCHLPSNMRLRLWVTLRCSKRRVILSKHIMNQSPKLAGHLLYTSTLSQTKIFLGYLFWILLFNIQKTGLSIIRNKMWTPMSLLTQANSDQRWQAILWFNTFLTWNLMYAIKIAKKGSETTFKVQRICKVHKLSEYSSLIKCKVK